MTVTGLTVYPVKSLGGVSVGSAVVEEQGLQGDRRWAVVEADGTKVTAREEPTLLSLRAEPVSDGSVRLVASDGASLVVLAPRDAEPVTVRFSGQDRAQPAGEAADRWISARLGRAVHLVWQDDAARRPIRRELGGLDGDRNSLSDAAPLHVTTEASLLRLNDWIVSAALERGEEPPTPLGHDRFRPNVVVSGSAPFAEDSWREAHIGEVPFRATMVCDRCVMTMIDRQSLASAKEPIRTLARHRKWAGATWFGIRLTPALPLTAGATIHVGDDVVPVPEA